MADRSQTEIPRPDDGSLGDVNTQIQVQTSPLVVSTPTSRTLTPMQTAIPLTTTLPAQSSSHSANSHHGFSAAVLTVVIVVPIIFLATVTPILILWCLSRRLKRKERRYPSREGGSRDISLPAKQSQQSSRNTSPQSLRQPQNTPRTRLSGFDFGFSRPVSTLSSSWSTQRSPGYPETRHFTRTEGPSLITLNSSQRRSGATHDPPLPYASRPVSTSEPNDNRASSRFGSREALTHPGVLVEYPTTDPSIPSDILHPPTTYGRVLTRESSRTGNVWSESSPSHHMRSNLQALFSAYDSVAFSDISGLSFDPALRDSTVDRRETHIISPFTEDGDHDGSGVRPYHMI